MIKFLILAFGAALIYLGATGQYKDVGAILGMEKPK